MKNSLLIILICLLGSIMLPTITAQSLKKPCKRITLDKITKENRRGSYFIDRQKIKNLKGFKGEVLFENYPNLIELNKNNSLKYVGKPRKWGPIVEYGYQLYHKGFPVDRHMCSVEEKDGFIYRITYRDLSADIDTTVLITHEEAVELAIKEVPGRYWWEHKGYDDSYPNPQLYIVKLKDTNEYKLCYKVNVYTWSPIDHVLLFIDPTTSEILYRRSQVAHCSVGKTAQKLFYY